MRLAFRRVFRLRLSVIILFAALFSILLAQIALIGPSLYSHEEHLIGDIREETTRLVKLATLRDVLDNLSEKELIELLETLSQFSQILGGQLYDTMGNSVGGFGIEASLSRNSVAADGVETLRSPNGEFYDIFVSQDKSGFGYDLILRLDTSHIPGEINAYMIQIAKLASIASTITIFGIILTLYFSMIRPIRRIRTAVKTANNNLDHAENYQLKYSRRDEIGEMGSAIDQLLLAVSAINKGNLSTSYDAITQSINAVIQYDPAGNLIFANSAALKFFCVNDIEELGKRDQKFFKLPKSSERRRQTLINSINSRLEEVHSGSYTEEGIVLINGLEVPVLIIARPVRNGDGKIQRYFATLVDISEMFLQRSKLKLGNDKLTSEKTEPLPADAGRFGEKAKAISWGWNGFEDNSELPRR